MKNRIFVCMFRATCVYVYMRGCRCNLAQALAFIIINTNVSWWFLFCVMCVCMGHKRKIPSTINRVSDKPRRSLCDMVLGTIIFLIFSKVIVQKSYSIFMLLANENGCKGFQKKKTHTHTLHIRRTHPNLARWHVNRSKLIQNPPIIYIMLFCLTLIFCFFKCSNHKLAYCHRGKRRARRTVFSKNMWISIWSFLMVICCLTVIHQATT